MVVYDCHPYKVGVRLALDQLVGQLCGAKGTYTTETDGALAAKILGQAVHFHSHTLVVIFVEILLPHFPLVQNIGQRGKNPSGFATFHAFLAASLITLNCDLRWIVGWDSLMQIGLRLFLLY